jgi:hypothetical protein
LVGAVPKGSACRFARPTPTSPCREKASDGGDIGCRFTPEMLEKALELRKKGIIKL